MTALDLLIVALGLAYGGLCYLVGRRDGNRHSRRECAAKWDAGYAAGRRAKLAELMRAPLEDTVSPYALGPLGRRLAMRGGLN